MHKKGRESLCVVFALVSLLFALTVCAQAAEVLGSGYLTGTITWSYDSDGTLVVRGTGAIPDYTKDSEETDLPWHIWTGDSKYSQYADHQKPHIKRIVVGKGITRVGNRAFVNCLYLDSVEIADYDGAHATSKENYTEYGRFSGSEGSDWCSEFAHWCARMAGVPTNVLGVARSAIANSWTGGTNGKYYRWSETVYGGEYEPQPGDLLQWAWDLDNHSPSEAVSHTSEAEFVNCNFENNSGSDNAQGVVQVRAGTTTISDCIFTGNNLPAIYKSGGSVIKSNCTENGAALSEAEEEVLVEESSAVDESIKTTVDVLESTVAPAAPPVIEEAPVVEEDPVIEEIPAVA